MNEQKNLFGEEVNEWRDHYKNLPEYNNAKQPDPLIVAKFKFRTIEDFDFFHEVIKKHLYDDKKVFDGMQKKDEKQAWFPLPPRPSHFIYEDDEK